MLRDLKNFIGIFRTGLVLVFFGLITWVVSAKPAAADTLDRAQAAYQSGSYEEASTLYLQHVEGAGPANASVFHNLGLAFDRQKELGAAVASYLRALQLQPRQGDFQYNLHFLLGKATDKLDGNFPQPFPAQLLLSRWASERELFYTTLAVFMLAMASLSYAWLRTRFRVGSLGAGGLFLVLALYGGFSLIYKLRYTPDQGAVAVPKLEAYSGPTQSVVIFELHAGAPLQILEKSGEWVKIELSDQKRGWVRASGIASFGSEHVILPTNLSSKS